MFSGRRGQDDVAAALESLGAQVAELRQRTEVVGRLADDAGHLEQLASEAARLNASTLAALEGAQAVVGEHVVTRPRFVPEWNAVYRADGLGLVVAWMSSGRTDQIQLLVGPADPPTDAISWNDNQNTFICGAVRPGEFWMLASRVGPGSGWKAMFTPLG
jgi:hypothetical protein